MHLVRFVPKMANFPPLGQYKCDVCDEMRIFEVGRGGKKPDGESEN
jgi:hypothetical protein